MTISEALTLLDGHWRWLRIGPRSASVYVRSTARLYGGRVAVRRKRRENLESMLVRLAEKAMSGEMKPEPSRGDRIAASLGIRLD